MISERNICASLYYVSYVITLPPRSVVKGLFAFALVLRTLRPTDRATRKTRRL